MALATVIATTASGAALAQPGEDNGWWRGPWHMWGDRWDMMGPGMMGPGMMPMMFVMMDTDGDGAVSFEEMQAVHKRMFDLVDEDKDGKMTIDEMRKFMGTWRDDN
jgi:hypothetical protein